MFSLGKGITCFIFTLLKENVFNIKTGNKMKVIKLQLFFLICVLFSIKVKAQTYQLFPIDSAEWSVLSYIGTTPENGHFYETIHYGISGDTTINSKTYHKIVSNTKTQFNISDLDNVYTGAFRESNKVIVWIRNGMTIEDTLYDFNLSIGNLLKCEYNSFILTDTVNFIDSIQLNSTYHKRYNTKIDSNITFLGNFSNSLVEGVGGLAGKRVFPFVDCSQEKQKVLLCFKRKKNVLYQNTKLNTCFYVNPPTNLNENSFLKKRTNIYPNPSTDEFTIQLNKIGLINTMTLKNMVGKVIFKSKIKNDKTKLRMSNYLSGIYFVEIQTDNNIEIHKIIKK